GGPTGVDLPGAFAEIKRDIIPKEFSRIDFSKMNVILLAGSPHTLNNMSEMSQNTSTKYLTDLGVVIKTKVFVTDYDGLTLKMNNGETIQTKHVIWAAGVTGNLIHGMDSQMITQTKRYHVDRQNKVLGSENIYAI